MAVVERELGVQTVKSASRRKERTCVTEQDVNEFVPLKDLFLTLTQRK